MYIVTSQMLNNLERRLVDFLKEYLTTIADRDKVTLWNLYHYLNETGRNTLDETASCKMVFDYIKSKPEIIINGFKEAGIVEKLKSSLMVLRKQVL